MRVQEHSDENKSPDDQARRNADSKLLTLFADRYDRKVRRDEYGDPIIRGRYGHIGIEDDGLLYAAFWGRDTSKTRARRINATILGRVGTLTQRGEDEAVFTFSPEDQQAAEWFIRNLAIKRKRRIGQNPTTRLPVARNRPPAL